MASPLDLEEQEQLDQFKHFWAQYGTAIMALVTVALLAFAGWNAWQWHQRSQADKAAMLFDELERVAQANEVDKVTQVFGDLKSRYPATTWAEQGGLLAAQVQQRKGQADAARASLEWVATQAGETEYQWLARLRLAGLLLDTKQADAALKQLDGDAPASFKGLVADRRGDVLQALGKRDDAVAAYQDAWKTLDGTLEYRQLIEAKLLALGVAPQSIIPATLPTEAKP